MKLKKYIRMSTTLLTLGLHDKGGGAGSWDGGEKRSFEWILL